MMLSLLVSMSFTSFCFSNRFLNSSWNSLFFDPICAASTLGGLLIMSVFLSTSTPSLMWLIINMWSLPTVTWLMTVTSVTMYGLFVKM